MTKANKWILLALILLILAVTNPTRAEYIEWAKAQALAETQGGLGGLLISALGGPVLEASTVAHNYAFFTVFETGDAKTVGILRQFLPLRTSRDSHQTPSITP